MASRMLDQYKGVATVGLYASSRSAFSARAFLLRNNAEKTLLRAKPAKMGSGERGVVRGRRAVRGRVRGRVRRRVRGRVRGGLGVG